MHIQKIKQLNTKWAVLLLTSQLLSLDLFEAPLNFKPGKLNFSSYVFHPTVTLTRSSAWVQESESRRLLFIESWFGHNIKPKAKGLVFISNFILFIHCLWQWEGAYRIAFSFPSLWLTPAALVVVPFPLFMDCSRTAMRNDTTCALPCVLNVAENSATTMRCSRYIACLIVTIIYHLTLAIYPLKHRRDSPNHRKRKYHCATCNRSFGDQSALNNHTEALHHRGSLKHSKCPFCPAYFSSPSAVAQHIESGRHGITRHQVTHAVKSLDIVLSICVSQRIEGSSPTPPTTIEYYVASPSSFNGRAYACFICRRMFRSLSSLSDHLNSAAHDAKEFKCPKCKKRFKLVSALTQHIESGACGLAQFHEIQGHFQGLTDQFSRLISM